VCPEEDATVRQCEAGGAARDRAPIRGARFGARGLTPARQDVPGPAFASVRRRPPPPTRPVPTLGSGRAI
jgi:hypothetical protein